jgi:two-component system OmpR family sensor kinase
LELIKTISEQLSIAIDRSASIEKVMIANHALMKKSLQIKKAFEQEKETRKMQGEFISLASHEFKTPLQIIDSTRELLVRKIKSSGLVDDSIDRGMERIKSAVQRMNGLIDSTLSLAKMEDAGNKIKVEKSEFDLAKLINDLVDSNHSLAAQKGVVVKIDILNLPQNFYGDQKLLDHSFANIISNAIKYSKNNTVVTIKSKVDNGFAYIVVTDQGIGIPQEDLSNIGKKFFRAKNTISVAGTGIGLYITKHFIELHQGSFKIKSVQNVGTSIAVALPL